MKQCEISFGHKGKGRNGRSDSGSKGNSFRTERFACLCLPEGDICNDTKVAFYFFVNGIWII